MQTNFQNAVFYVKSNKDYQLADKLPTRMIKKDLGLLNSKIHLPEEFSDTMHLNKS